MNFINYFFEVVLPQILDYFEKDLYEHGIFNDKTITDIKDDYAWNKENDQHKDHDDFEL